MGGPTAGRALDGFLNMTDHPAMQKLRAAVERGGQPGFGRWEAIALRVTSHGDMRVLPSPKKHHNFFIFGFEGQFAKGYARTQELAMVLADDHLYAMAFFEKAPEIVYWDLEI